jgi:hypothetical protein
MELEPRHIDILTNGAVFLGSADGAGRPDLIRCFGAQVLDDRKMIRVLVSRPWAASVAANVRPGGWVAFSFTNVLNYESYQAKGRVVRVDDTDEPDAELAARHRDAFARDTISIGVHESARDYAYQPALAVTFAIESLYCQTPGPGAGRPVGGGE